MDRFEIRQYYGEKVINIREITSADANTLSSMADGVNWNVSPAECAFMTTAGNTKAFFLEVDGEVAGSAGMVTYEPQSMVFINLVIVKEKFRRKGYATKMVEHILELTRNYKTKRLHATPDGSKVYAPLGFQPCRTISFFATDDPHLCAPAGIGVHAMQASEVAAAVQRDAECFGFSRRELMEFNFDHFGNHALVSDDGKAHIWSRRWKKYRQMAALVSEDLPTAMALAARASELDRSQAQSIICYDSQSAFKDFLREGNFVQVREMVDMFYGDPDEDPPIKYRTIYGGDMG